MQQPARSAPSAKVVPLRLAQRDRGGADELMNRSIQDLLRLAADRFMAEGEEGAVRLIEGLMPKAREVPRPPRADRAGGQREGEGAA